MKNVYGKRKSIRLKDYDYTQEGAYYVTICTHDRKCIFGYIKDGKMILNEPGKSVEYTWYDLPNHNNNIELDEFVVMPNHVHGIIVIVGAGSKPALIHERAGYEPAPTVHGLSEMIRQFKTFSAKRINKIDNATGTAVWQRNYYEHVIRNEHDLSGIREYILMNPIMWNNDKYYSN